MKLRLSVAGLLSSSLSAVTLYFVSRVRWLLSRAFMIIYYARLRQYCRFRAALAPARIVGVARDYFIYFMPSTAREGDGGV